MIDTVLPKCKCLAIKVTAIHIQIHLLKNATTRHLFGFKIAVLGERGVAAAPLFIDAHPDRQIHAAAQELVQQKA